MASFSYMYQPVDGFYILDCSSVLLVKIEIFRNLVLLIQRLNSEYQRCRYKVQKSNQRKVFMPSCAHTNCVLMYTLHTQAVTDLVLMYKDTYSHFCHSFLIWRLKNTWNARLSMAPHTMIFSFFINLGRQLQIKIRPIWNFELNRKVVYLYLFESLVCYGFSIHYSAKIV